MTPPCDSVVITVYQDKSFTFITKTPPRRHSPKNAQAFAVSKSPNKYIFRQGERATRMEIIKMNPQT